jgi:hypothetical protein
MTDAAAGTCAAVGLLHRPDIGPPMDPCVGVGKFAFADAGRPATPDRAGLLCGRLFRKGRSIPALLILCSPLFTLCNEASATLAGNIDPEPAHGDGQTMAQADQEIDVSESPQPSREPTRELDPAKIDNGGALADRRETAGILSRTSGPDFRPRSRALIVSAT